jgi:hypothetical protein
MIEARQAANLLSACEDSSKMALSLHGLLAAKGDENLALLAWVLHLRASMAAEAVGEMLWVVAETN